MERPLKGTQRLNRLLHLRINTTSPTIVRGSSDIASVVKNSTGNITINFKNAFLAIPIAVATSEAANCVVGHAAAPTAAHIQLLQQTIGGVATDGIMDIMVWGFDTADVY